MRKRRSKSLTAQAISGHIEHELAIIEGIKKGLDDLETGRLVSHDEAMAEIYAVIDAVEAAGDSKT